MPLAPENLWKNPKTSNHRIFSTTTSNFAFIIYIYMFVAFIDCCVCLVLGNIVSEPFVEDFQNQAFEESQFSLQGSKASALDHFVPI
jgi:hypothetical protein